MLERLIQLLNARWSVYYLFVSGLTSHWWIYHPYGDDSITAEVIQILAYAQNSWPLSSEGSLTCHTMCDMGHPFIMVISRDPWHSHLLKSVWQCIFHYLFSRLTCRLVAVGIRSPNLPHTIRTLRQLSVKLNSFVLDLIDKRISIGRTCRLRGWVFK